MLVCGCQKPLHSILHVWSDVLPTDQSERQRWASGTTDDIPQQHEGGCFGRYDPTERQSSIQWYNNRRQTKLRLLEENGKYDAYAAVRAR